MPKPTKIFLAVEARPGSYTTNEGPVEASPVVEQRLPPLKSRDVNLPSEGQQWVENCHLSLAATDLKGRLD